jgi:hypothetical protein
VTPVRKFRMLRIRITADERAVLSEASYAEDAPWWFRGRVEMVLLSAAGWRVPGGTLVQAATRYAHGRTFSATLR